MSPIIMLAAAALGGVGAVLRMELDGWVNRHITPHNRWNFPLGTIVVNLTACFLLGLLTGLASAQIVSAQARYLLGSGLLGGYSTFSTASVEGVQLLRASRPWAALTHTGGMLVLSLATAWLGFVLA